MVHQGMAPRFHPWRRRRDIVTSPTWWMAWGVSRGTAWWCRRTIRKRELKQRLEQLEQCPKWTWWRCWVRQCQRMETGMEKGCCDVDQGFGFGEDRTNIVRIINSKQVSSCSLVTLRLTVPLHDIMSGIITATRQQCTCVLLILCSVG